MQLSVVGRDGTKRSFREEMADYIRQNFSDVLGYDAELLETEAGLEELSRKTLSMCRDAVRSAA